MPQLLSRPGFPRCDAYDPDWIIRGSMVPDPRWLAEGLLQALDLTPGERVLELGCGKAITPIDRRCLTAPRKMVDPDPLPTVRPVSDHC